jgi:hypothetical protein
VSEHDGKRGPSLKVVIETPARGRGIPLVWCGGRPVDLLIALNSGLPGMSTQHANSARETLVEMCTLPLLAGDNVSAALAAWKFSSTRQRCPATRARVASRTGCGQ